LPKVVATVSNDLITAMPIEGDSKPFVSDQRAETPNDIEQMPFGRLPVQLDKPLDVMDGPNIGYLCLP
jgi:hypothetical protein